MAGNTGKMTREDIARRGPRMVLWVSDDNISAALDREDGRHYPGHRILARSYSRSYLMKILKTNTGITFKEF